MRSTRASDKKKSLLPEPRDVSGIALFMVMSAIGVLSILVSEFAYIAQINERMAYDSLDQVKAHYLAKAGLKLSLLRLKAYAQLKGMTGGGGGGAAGGSNPLAGAVPASVLNKIWSFPFMYPLPALPDMTVSQKDQIQEFEKQSDVDGRYSAIIESESSKFDLNMIVPGWGPTISPSPSASPGASPAVPPQPGPGPSPSGSFGPEEARKSLHDYLQNLMTTKMQNDEDFQRNYQDFRLDDVMDYFTQWADHGYISNFQYPREGVQPKRAPFYSITEMHMIPTIDDDLYNLFAEGLTVSATPGININTMQEPTLRALVPQMTNDEVTDFFKFRDDPTVDNNFKKDTDFFDYLSKNVAAFRGSQDAMGEYQSSLQQRHIRLVTDETDFKITVQATVNQAVRTIEAYVQLNGTGSGPVPSPGPAGAAVPPLSGPGAQQTPVPDSGLKINFMRVL